MIYSQTNVIYNVCYSFVTMLTVICFPLSTKLSDSPFLEYAEPSSLCELLDPRNYRSWYLEFLVLIPSNGSEMRRILVRLPEAAYRSHEGLRNPMSLSLDTFSYYFAGKKNHIVCFRCFPFSGCKARSHLLRCHELGEQLAG